MRGGSLLLILFVVFVTFGLVLAAGPILAVPFLVVVALIVGAFSMRHRLENTLRVRRFRSQAVGMDPPPRDQDGRDHTTLYDDSPDEAAVEADRAARRRRS